MAEAIPSLARKYFCFECNARVNLFQSEEKFCSECHSDFIEEVPYHESEYESEFSDDDDDDGFSHFVRDFYRMIENPCNAINQNEMDPFLYSGSIFRASPLFQDEWEPELYDFDEFERVLNSYRTYFGEDLDELRNLTAIYEDKSPLSKDQIKLLPVITISKEDENRKKQCTICLENFAVSEKVKCLPCDHMYHESCIQPWLDQRDTCPNCRELIKLSAQNSLYNQSNQLRSLE